MEMKRGFLLTSFINGRTIRYNTFTNHNLHFLHITLYSHVNLQRNDFLYKKYFRDYTQLYSQLFLSKVYSEHYFSFYNIFFILQSYLYQIILLAF